MQTSMLKAKESFRQTLGPYLCISGTSIASLAFLLFLKPNMMSSVAFYSAMFPLNVLAGWLTAGFFSIPFGGMQVEWQVIPGIATYIAVFHVLNFLVLALIKICYLHPKRPLWKRFAIDLPCSGIFLVAYDAIIAR